MSSVIFLSCFRDNTFRTAGTSRPFSICHFFPHLLNLWFISMRTSFGGNLLKVSWAARLILIPIRLRTASRTHACHLRRVIILMLLCSSIFVFWVCLRFVSVKLASRCARSTTWRLLRCQWWRWWWSCAKCSITCMPHTAWYDFHPCACHTKDARLLSRKTRQSVQPHRQHKPHDDDDAPGLLPFAAFYNLYLEQKRLARYATYAPARFSFSHFNLIYRHTHTHTSQMACDRPINAVD